MRGQSLGGGTLNIKALFRCLYADMSEIRYFVTCVIFL